MICSRFIKSESFSTNGVGSDSNEWGVSERDWNVLKKYMNDEESDTTGLTGVEAGGNYYYIDTLCSIRKRGW